MHLIEQFRVLGLDGQQHSVACYEDFYERLDRRGDGEPIHTARRYCLDGGQDVQRVDNETFLTVDGSVLHRVPAARRE